MEILEGEALYRLLLDRYSRNPRGWSITISPSPRNGFFDAMVGGPEESWHLKLDTIFKPSPFVLGAKTDQAAPSGRSPVSFGFRRLDPADAPGLFEESPEGINRLLAYLSTVNPVAPAAPGSYVQGPYVFSNRAQTPGSSMTREQQSVDTRLSDEMVKLVRKRYPSYL
ncbi:MAG TPA: hypothetical protein VLX56_06735 [Nitrososphaerales archaeon]|nr:hypothetical protein [Nitrososphaerales archaeon]